MLNVRLLNITSSQTTRESNPGKGKRSCSSTYSAEELWEPTQFPRVRRPERHVDHAPPSSPGIKGEWSYNTNSTVRLYGEGSNKFNVFFFNSRQHISHPSVMNAFYV